MLLPKVAVDSMLRSEGLEPIAEPNDLVRNMSLRYGYPHVDVCRASPSWAIIDMLSQ